MNRPPELVAAVILAIFLALFTALMSSMAIATAHVDKDPRTRSIMDPIQLSGPAAIVLWMGRRALLIGIARLAWALVGIIVAVELLRLRSWARPALEGLAWLALAYMLALRSLWIALRLSLPAPSSGVTMLAVAFDGISFLIFVLPFAALIYLLGGARCGKPSRAADRGLLSDLLALMSACAFESLQSLLLTRRPV
ncbi:MAG TPA: hypothetical protein VGM86_09160 [Thermoanaerobaculia bacterium]|jgi:hypothetical protein